MVVSTIGPLSFAFTESCLSTTGVIDAALRNRNRGNPRSDRDRATNATADRSAPRRVNFDRAGSFSELLAFPALYRRGALRSAVALVGAVSVASGVTRLRLPKRCIDHTRRRKTGIP